MFSFLTDTAVWGDRTFKFLCVIAAGQSLLASADGSRAIVFHRHGAYALHLHIVSAGVLAADSIAPHTLPAGPVHGLFPPAAQMLSTSSEHGVTYLLPVAFVPTHDTSEEQRSLQGSVSEPVDAANGDALQSAAQEAKAILALRGAAFFVSELHAASMLQYELPLLI